METDIILFGASGHCKVIIDLLESKNLIVKKIIDDNILVTEILSKKVIHSDLVKLNKTDKVIISIGNNEIRKKIAKKTEAFFESCIHLKSIVSKYATIDLGTVVLCGAIINPNTRIGKHCIINSGAVVEHDCIIEDFVHISPNVSLAGNVTIGEGTHVGIGACVIQGITIGKWVTVGAGSVIIDNVPDYAVIVGNPGRIIKYKYNNNINKYL